MYDVIVVGGGIVGLSTAYHLVCAGLRTLLIDRADTGQATAAGAGILAPETSSSESEAWYDFAVAAVAYYPTLLERLGGDGTGYAPTDQLIVAVSQDEDAAFDEARQRIMARQHRSGRRAPTELAAVDSDEAQRRFPLLAPVRAALHYRKAARVDGRLLAAALHRAALRLGLSVRRAPVEHVVVERDAVTGVVAAGETVVAGAVVLAGGAWSPSLARRLGLSLPIVPMRGQIIHLSLPDHDTAAWPIITAFHGHYIVPWPDQRVVVGATREPDSGFVPHTTAAGVAEVLGEALRVAPGLAAATIADIRVGLRPATPDKLPLLGPLPAMRNVYVAAGHGATGLQLGPYSGKVVAYLVAGQTLDTDITAFDAGRFAPGSA